MKQKTFRPVLKPIQMGYTEALSEMTPGTDRFFIKAKNTTIQCICSRLRKAHGMNFQTRTEKGGVRVWRF